MKSVHGLMVSGCLVAALAGCVPVAPEPTVTPSVSPTDKPTLAPSPTPEVTLPPLAIPDCETLLPLAIAQSEFSANTEFLGDFPASEFSGYFRAPSEDLTLVRADPSRGCRWGIPNSDGTFRAAVAGIEHAQAAALQEELTSIGFAGSTAEGVTTLQLSGEAGATSLSTTHIFTGSAWIIVEMTGPEASRAVATAILESLRTANPTLGL